MHQIPSLVRKLKTTFVDILSDKLSLVTLSIQRRLSVAVMIGSLALTSCSGDGEGLNANGQPIGGNPPPNTNDPYSAVQEIFDSRCTVCHAGASAPAGLILSAGQSFSAMVGVPSTQIPELMLVNPGNADDSYLVQKIRGDSTIVGGQMPRNGPPFLSEAQIATVIDWVSAGALPPLPVDPNAEFIVEISDFANFQDWESIDYSSGQTNDALAAAHQGLDNNFSRRVYRNPTAVANADGNYPNGSIFVKRVTTFQNGEEELSPMNGVTAMVKRGQSFNQNHNGWEWIVLSDDASEIQTRGPDVGMCGACHSQAQSQEGGSDFIFPHPSEIVLENDAFVGYSDWAQIDDRDDDNPLLGGSAHGATIAGARRVVYQDSLYANPDTEAQGYPVGTRFVKEVYDGDALVEVTAMVKRGGDFNPNNNYWEWFELDPETALVAQENGVDRRGEEIGSCNACHSSATLASGNGIDYVFKHSAAPFNNNDEFVADLASFSDYLQWDQVDYTIGDINPAIAGGHQGASDLYSRRTYANPVSVMADGEIYPKGSIFVKEVTTWESGSREFSPMLGLVGMAKRGSNFNPDHNGWEWFELANDNSQIIGRGGDYRDNGCNNCHIQADDQEGGGDYIFRHRSEFVAMSEDFSAYKDWAMIDESSGNDPLLGGMAHKGDDLEAIRRVYKKQLYANPEDIAFGFPVGTMIVKEVSQNDVITELGAMVKRGGEFNEDHQTWEWFILNPDDATIATEDGQEMRGGDLMNGMCNSCHSLAASDAEPRVGSDYVFYHDDDPVNSGN